MTCLRDVLKDRRCWAAIGVVHVPEGESSHYEIVTDASGNADVLVDVHWIGGDPAKAEIYGWASWSKRKGILSLRNPSDQPAAIAIDISEAFELTSGAAQSYLLRSPWKRP